MAERILINKGKKAGKRIPMPEGTVFPVTGTDILIARDGKENEYSSGSTCLVYRGHIVSGTGIVTGMHVIIKEYYPSSCSDSGGLVRLPDGSLVLEKGGEADVSFYKNKEQFLQGLEYQKELAGSNAMEISIRPLFISNWGNTVYIISDAHRGSDLNLHSPGSLKEAVSVAISFAETMGILHENGYIMTDIKADNFLWIQKPNSVRIIDSDSLVPFRDPVRMMQKPLFANKNHRAPELDFLQIKMREGIPAKEMRMLKRVMLTPQTDLYSEGVFFFELFFKRLPGFSDFRSYIKQCAENKTDGKQQLIDELAALYGSEIRESGSDTTRLLSSVLSILEKMLIRNPAERRSMGYRADGALVSDLEEIYAQLSSDKIVLRREAASANARFTAYNLLQKYPLFDYAVPAALNARPCAATKAAAETDGKAAAGTDGEAAAGTDGKTAAGTYGEASADTDGKAAVCAATKAAAGKELRVAIVGSHVMRTDILSAVLSIGQMPDMPLVVELISEDAEAFWKDYLSKKNNPGLAGAVTWEYAQDSRDGQSPASMEFDDRLVSRPLAHLIIDRRGWPESRVRNYTGTKAASADKSSDAGHEPYPGYYIILEESPEKKKAWIRYAARRAAQMKQAAETAMIEDISMTADISMAADNSMAAEMKRAAGKGRAAGAGVPGPVFIGYLRFENEEPSLRESLSDSSLLADSFTRKNSDSLFPHNQNTASSAEVPYTLYAISAEAFTEDYSEKMFSEKIYHMGLMAHAYYCKALDSDEEIDMAALERDFRKDFYNITSSERCALHGVYKMAGIGIDSKRPGHIRKFNRMINDPAVLEKLAWLEHLSWTAFMLTSGAVPVSMDEFEKYAYTGSNDWKDKSNSAHIRHPLLVASGYSTENTLQGIQSPEEITPEMFERLDPLDKVSVRITRWYASRREDFKACYLTWLEDLTALCKGTSHTGGASLPETAEPAGTAFLPSGKNSPGEHDTLQEQKNAQETPGEETVLLLSALRQSGLECIELAGSSLVPLEPACRMQWLTAVQRMQDLYSGSREVLDLLLTAKNRIMKPVFHSFEDRDFKQNDRELTNAVMDIIS